jgi:hypothetical protein
MTDQPLRLRLARAHITFDIQIDDGETLRSIGTIIKDQNGQPGTISAIVEGTDWPTYATTGFLADMAALEAQVNETGSAAPTPNRATRRARASKTNPKGAA